MANHDAILVINAGSSSIKFSVFAVDGLRLVVSGQVDNVMVSPQCIIKNHTAIILQTHLDTIGHPSALLYILDWLDVHLHPYTITAVGHRVVHGGTRFASPVVVTAPILEALETLIPLAPLHQPHNLAAIQIIAKRNPHLPQLACFDTAFHATQPHLARLFALPRAYSDEGIIRYGFHGLSYEYITSVLPQYVGDLAKGRVIIAHLGNGASMCAVREGKSIATTMGFTALDGLVMGTRPGAIDPGILLYLMEQKGLSPERLNHVLYKQSGLLGVSGISHDMRELEQSGTPEAREAIDLFCYRAAREVGSLMVALGGLDVLVFTAGIGEKSALVRQKIITSMAWFGLVIDATHNARHETNIHAEQSTVKLLVIPTNEEYTVAQHTIKISAYAQ